MQGFSESAMRRSRRFYYPVRMAQVTGQKKIEAIKREIERSFASVPYPGDENITRLDQDTPSGQPYHCDECEEIALLLRNKKWQEWKNNPVELIRPPSDQGIPALLTPEAFQYYLPLILLASLTQYEKANLLPGNLITIFAPAKENLKNYQTERIKLLTKDQLACVLTCLRFLSQEHGKDFPGFNLDGAIKLVAFELGRRAS